MLDLVRRLGEESEIFQRIWEEQQVLFPDEKERSYYHPQRGVLKFSQTTFLAAAAPALKLIIFQPSG